ncbi:hypothetical protein P3342_008334 [Pyrenophora teres f. teres]|uniref:Uncharacterized protein n=1 Tax=Pyrenophora teres f. teres TaxID=97479 RepID=A0A6S6W5J4_9PLEO|nr:hypothetical protein PTNB85_07069 [Pyrenophora teres f. teres]KAE8857517.1 hypothetical protein PTNB29_08584 [Pyrenophora teres f. teres]KAK1910455.1 hypothetical protein P3342_008334 [Pyrenophora teres f. teres]CAE7185246.1 hypothetical protein PTTW11_06771 [Pyrenophora teres f. teres]
MATPINIDPPGGKGKNKRAAEDDLPIPVANENSVKDTGPRIVSRHHNRRTNIATEFWGPEVYPETIPTTPAATSPRRFNVYKAILRHKDLFFQLVLRTPYKELVQLYAIDKEFHYRFNHYNTYLIHEYVRRHAPLAAHIFSWVLFPNVCISDPMLRPMDGREWLARDVPGFRWVGMVLSRQKIVRSILTMLSMEGHRVPAACEAALMKFWCLMGMNRAMVRAAFLRDRKIWTDGDLINFQLFLVKLDMRLSDPILGNGTCQLGPMLLSQKSLSTLWKVLSGKLKLNYDTASDMILRTYVAEELNFNANPTLDEEVNDNVPVDEEGLLSLEGWNQHGARMPHAIDMVIAESIMRELHVEQYYLDFVLYGTADPKTGKNIPIPVQLRRDKEVKLPSEGMPTKETMENLIKMMDKTFGTMVPGRPSAKHRT